MSFDIQPDPARTNAIIRRLDDAVGDDQQKFPDAARRILTRPAVLASIVPGIGIDAREINQIVVNIFGNLGDNSWSMEDPLEGAKKPQSRIIATQQPERQSGNLISRFFSRGIQKPESVFVPNLEPEIPIVTRRDAAVVGLNSMLRYLRSDMTPNEALLWSVQLLNPIMLEGHTKKTTVVTPWYEIQDPRVKFLGSDNYQDTWDGTPLRNRTIGFIGSTIDMLLALKDQYKKARAFIGIYSDGLSTDKKEAPEARDPEPIAIEDVRTVVEAAQNMRDSDGEGGCIVYGYYISGRKTDKDPDKEKKLVDEELSEFLGFGIPRPLILRSGSSVDEIARVFGRIKKAAAQAGTEEGIKALTLRGFDAVPENGGN